TKALSEIVKAVRPLGKIILKSRQCEPVALSLIPIIKKELTIQAVNYGSFTQALNMVANRQFDVEELLGQSYKLDEFELAFKESNKSGSLKLFFSIAD